MPEASCLEHLEVPYFDLSILVAKYDLNAVGMENSAINHDSTIVILSHVSLALEIKYLDGAIFASSEKPLVLSLKVHGNYVAIEAVKRSFLIQISQIVDFDKAKCACTKIFEVV